MITWLMQVGDPSTLIADLVQIYGITGAAFGSLLFIMMKQNKSSQVRIEKLESQQKEQYESQLSEQKNMISEYSDLAQHTTRVLGDLTGCLKAMKSTIERIDKR